MKLLILSLVCLAGTAQAKTVLSTIAACSQAELSKEPLAQRAFYVEPKLKVSLKTSAFDPESLKDLFTRSGINRAGVSTSHIVNIISEGIEKLNDKEQELVQKGELLQVVKGRTYGEEEYALRQDSVNKAREKYFLPMMNNLYQAYLSALQRDHAKAKALKAGTTDAAAAKKFYALAEQQRKILSAVIQKYRPGILKKLGEIDVVSEKQDLPFSYKDGYIVKLRFKKKNAPSHVTIYPRMMLNLLDNTNGRFVVSLQRWKDFTYDQWNMAYQYRTGATWSKSIGRGFARLTGDDSIEAMIVKEPLMKEAFFAAKADLKNTYFVNSQIAQLTDDEVYFLMDLMRELRQNDMPMCSGTLKRLNAAMRPLLKGKKSTAFLNAADRAKADAYASQVIFYQDQYEAFAGAAAHKLSEKR